MSARLPDGKPPSESRGNRRLLVGSRVVSATIALLGPVCLLLSARAGDVFASLVTVMTWMPAVILAVVFQTSLACPRCGRPFFRAGTRLQALVGKYANLLSNRCLHCGVTL
jgi:hypothetical protein